MFIKQSLKSIVTTWLTGLLALLPLVLTLALLAWIVSLLNRLVGPSTLIGQLFGALGQPFSSNTYLAYTLGSLVLLLSLYPLGLAVQLGLRRPLSRLLDVTLRRTPLIGNLYALADRFVGLLDKTKNPDIAAMKPVWCFFGGDGVAVLALQPSSQAVLLEGREHYAVLVPTAPIPIGGGLLYVPVEWVKPANMGVDALTGIYVSMGLTPPPPQAQAIAPAVVAGTPSGATGQH
ncbi:DUF502 domain-containing protein [Stutzerimonas kirkiae]|uniref:DUF502 domain-containing protein n=1 Tax=Stutzerimonas kirkiae TaxID=2211392 RepID=A0A4Q9R169_9GAMM|nr:DUF502 domain-containing protein [Stutzerimonas kirkiae]TBU92626.1 hypothetical protein DNJ96_14835 [Stutzerimonas kirkiae]TBV00818.1 hypothetical protein DNJ95_13720 [Stutzerimonas kirkiae]TBV08709.1 hypothetical protein DNK08_10225 [Stutzerimonas kirkiae]TBV11507.1 hypothetical protein DNK01_16300 [Stutzerimonas kirkiae]